MRTGKLVVRYQSPWRRRAVLVAGALGALLLLYVVYEWGRFDGGYHMFAGIQARRELSTTIATLRQQIEELRAELAAAKLARSVDGKAYADVEQTLADLQARVLKQKEELTFYRGIVSPEDGIGGLRIQRFQVLSGGADRHYRLRLVLVQSMRQDSVVSGSVNVQIEGVRDNRPATLTLADTRVRNEGAAQQAGAKLSFRFRYFQNLERDIVLPAGFEPRAVNVEVHSSRLSPVRESYPWQVQAES